MPPTPEPVERAAQHSVFARVSPAFLGLASLVVPAVVYLLVFPPTYGVHGTSLGARGLSVLASGWAPGIAALVQGTRALRAKKAGSRVLPILGMGAGVLGLLWTGFLWFVAFFVGY
jgi:hypothetical protein